MHYRLTATCVVYKNLVPAGKSIPIVPGKAIRIGRGKEAEYQVFDRRVSRVHVEVEIIEGRPWITDQKSSNGTFVNGKAETQRALHEGDKLGIGDVTFLLEASEAGWRETAHGGGSERGKRTEHEMGATRVMPSVARCESCGAVVEGARAAPVFCAKCTDPLVERTLGQFHVAHRIAGGTMSVVFRAEHVATKRAYALKALTPDAARNPAMAERFRKEVDAGKRLEHPNHACVHESGEADGRPYLVADLAPGEPVSRTIEEKGKFDTDRGCAIGAQVAAALAFAERKGLVHGELGAESVIVGRDVETRVVGFGGCPWSEETAQKDLDGLGRLMCLLLSGKLPTSADPAAEAAKLLSAEPAPLVEAVWRLFGGPSSDVAATPLGFLVDALPFAVRKRGRAGLPPSLRERVHLNRLAPEAAEVEAAAAVLRARLWEERPPAIEGYAIAVAHATGGGLPQVACHAVPQSRGSLGLLAASCPTGDIAGSIVLSILRASFHALALLMPPPSQLLVRLNEKVRGPGDDGILLRTAYAVLDPANDSLTFCLAGAAGPLVLSAETGKTTSIASGGSPLGAPESAPGPQQEVHLDPGDRAFLWAGGRPPKGGTSPEAEAAEAALPSGAQGTVEEQAGAVAAAVQASMGRELRGGVLVVGMERLRA